MTTQRQYTLPNCNLIVEGMTTDANDPASPLSVVMNVECQLPGATDATLTGGREFLDHLVAAVSLYAQQLLSGVPQPIQAIAESPPMITMKPGEGFYHHLIVRDQAKDTPPTDAEATAPLDVRLSTVQFHDLMEAIDQLLADTLTLPDLQPQFQSISRRQVKPSEPAAKRAAPAAIGAAALAAAGLAFFFVPPPEFEPSQSSPDSDTPAETTDTGLTDPPGTSAEDAIPPETDDLPPTSEPGTDDTTSGDINPDEDAPETGLEDSEATPSAADAAAAVDRLSSAPAITDAATLTLLRDDLRRTLANAWDADSRPEEDLEYRVAVAEDGDILGYKYQDSAALEAVDNTPLPDLAFQPTDDTAPIPEAVAQFLIRFTPDGEVEVEPTGNSASSVREGAVDAPADSTTATPLADTAELSAIEEPIADRTTLEALVRTLRRDIADHLDPLSANQDLTYQVRLTADGEVVGYAPVDAESGLLAAETPLPALVSAANTEEDVADFRVVFTEDGVIQVSPWEGWPQ
jgi:hypothetical protein